MLTALLCGDTACSHGAPIASGLSDETGVRFGSANKARACARVGVQLELIEAALEDLCSER